MDENACGMFRGVAEDGVCSERLRGEVKKLKEERAGQAARHR